MQSAGVRCCAANQRRCILSLCCNGLAAAEFHKLALSATTDHGNASTTATPNQPTADQSPDFQHAADTPSSPVQPFSGDVLRLIHDQLLAAEAANRADDALAEYDALNRLGLFFEQRGRLPLAAYQYRRCLGVAEGAAWLQGRMAAHLALGLGVHASSAFCWECFDGDCVLYMACVSRAWH